MPKETTIGVSKATLKMLKDYQKEFGFNSSDEAVSNSVRWARLWSYVDTQQRRSILERINNLEEQFNNLRKLVSFCLTSVYVNKNGEKKENVK